MIGKAVQYNKDMRGVIIDENNDHVLIRFDSGCKYCVSKSSISESIIK